MTTKLHVLRLYADQVVLARLLSLATIGVAIATSVLLEVVMPFLVATIIEKLSHGDRIGLADVRGLLLGLFGCAIGGTVLGPLRQRLRRKLHDRGYTGLKDNIQRVVTQSPSVNGYLNKMAMKEFLDTWEQFIFVFIEQFVPFLVGAGGLIVILLWKAPLAVVPVVLVLGGAVVIARSVGNIVGSTWSDYKEKDHEEQTILGNLVAGAHMLWLTKLIIRLLDKADAARSKAMNAYIKAMVRYQSVMAGLNLGFKVATITSGTILGLAFGVPFTVTSLLLVYGLTLGDRMATIFSMNDMLTSSAANAEVLVRGLEEAKPLGPELRATRSIVVCQNVTVEYRDHREEAKAKQRGLPPPPPVVVELPPEIIIGPGITLLLGPSGCGKTTLVRAWNGLPYKGSITLGGVELAGQDPRPRIVYGQQSFEAFDEAITLDLFGGETADLELVNRALWCAGYAEAPLQRSLTTYSGGQWKRLMLAAEFYSTLQRDRSLAGLLALDEPTNHLDSGTVEKPGSVERLLTGLRWLADNDPGLAIPIVTHEPRLKDIADDIIFMGVS